MAERERYLKCNYQRMDDTIQGYEEYLVTFMSPAQYRKYQRVQRTGSHKSENNPVKNNLFCYVKESELFKITAKGGRGEGRVRLDGIYRMDEYKIVVGIKNIRHSRIFNFSVPRSHVIFCIPEKVS